MKYQRLDSISLDQTYYTEEGYLVDHPIVTTCGIFEYKNEDGSMRRELRLPEDVFNEKSLKSYKGKPIIITHDAGEVSKDNVRREQIGTIMSEGYQDGDSVRCEIIIHDTNALKRCGLKELSLGYSLDTEETPGVWRGEKYDCIQRNIEINHLALVAEARAGDSARLNIDGKDDDNKKILKGGKVVMYKPNETGQRSDGAEELTPEEMEAAVALFLAQKAAGEATATAGADGEEIPPGNGEDNSTGEEPKSPIDQVRDNMDRRDSESGSMSSEDIIAGQNADLKTLLEEIDKLQASNDMNGDAENIPPVEPDKVGIAGEENSDGEAGTEENKDKGVNMDSVDQMFKDRLDICRMADKLNLDGVENLSLTEGRKCIIKAVNPKVNLDGKSETYIKAAYDIAKDTYASRRSTDDQRKKMAEDHVRRDASEESSSETARKNMINKMIGGKK
ncbi:MAG: DUF2213 domain-containing protein [Lachnospiraceae bacterium]|nr:DUF2213 domain-containing protein [Lachnospiraceae bacterium]